MSVDYHLALSDHYKAVRARLNGGPPPRPVAIAPPQPKDQCGMADAKAFIGKKRTDLPAPVDPTRWRVACTTCPVTMDFRPDRLNILFDESTGVIREVKCG